MSDESELAGPIAVSMFIGAIFGAYLMNSLGNRVIQSTENNSIPDSVFMQQEDDKQGKDIVIQTKSKNKFHFYDQGNGIYLSTQQINRNEQSRINSKIKQYQTKQDSIAALYNKKQDSLRTQYYKLQKN